jgi:hypothetical protein
MGPADPPCTRRGMGMPQVIARAVFLPKRFRKGSTAGSTWIDASCREECIYDGSNVSFGTDRAQNSPHDARGDSPGPHAGVGAAGD